MPSSTYIKLRPAGKIPTTAVTNELATAINIIEPRVVGAPHRGSAKFPVVGIVWDTGPASEANYTDQRYWVRLAVVSGSDSDGIATIAAIDSTDTEYWFTAENLAERSPVTDTTGNATAGTHTLAKGTQVHLWLSEDTDGTARWQFSLNVPGFFPVKVSQTGGSNGNKTTAASYTYTVTTMDGNTTLGEDVAVAKTRPNGTMTAGSSYGMAFYDENGDIQLWDAGEVEGTGGC